MNRWMKCAALMLVLGTVACEDTVAPPEPGTALINLTTTANDAGAVLITLTGPGITDVKPANSSYDVFWRLAAENEMRVIVLGSIAPGPLLIVQVGDVGRLESYTSELIDVADRNGALKATGAGYALSMSRLSGR